jgi:hypothetical protein
MRRIGGICAAAFIAMALAACGEEDKAGVAQASAPKVAMTLSWPGVPPWALITYTRGDGTRCAAIGSLTDQGPQVVNSREKTLAAALAAHGRCLDRKRGPVFVQVEQSSGREVQILGGLADKGIRKLKVAGQTVVPDRHGAFLLIHADGADSLGTSFTVEYRGGAKSSFAMPKLRAS